MNTAEIREITPEGIGAMDPICAHDSGATAAWYGGAVQESADLCRRTAVLGRRVFGAFREGGQVVGRVETMPINVAPLPLVGEDLTVMRCLWVVKEAQGHGHGKALVERALDAAEGTNGVAIVCYPGWNDVPESFLARFGFQTVQRQGIATLLLRTSRAGASVAFAPDRPAPELSPVQVLVEAVFSGMCPAATQYYRRLLDAARSLSDLVVAKERMLRDRADALRFGRENTVYIDGDEPLSGPFRTTAFCELVKARLASKA